MSTSGFYLPDPRAEWGFLAPGMAPLGTVQVDYSNTIAKDLCFGKTASMRNDFVGDVEMTPHVVGINVGTDGGYAHSFIKNVGDNYTTPPNIIKTPNSTGIITTSTGDGFGNYTLLVVCTNLTASYGFVFGQRAQGPTEAPEAYACQIALNMKQTAGVIGPNDDGTWLQVRGAGGDWAGISATNCLVGDDLTLNVIVAKQSETEQMIYTNGVLRNTITQANNQGIMKNEGTSNITLGTWAGPTFFVQGAYSVTSRVTIAMAWDRALSDGEIAEISRDPYQFLIPA